MRTSVLAFVVVVLLALSGPEAFAQRLDGTLRVDVTDSSGASILDAKVTVTNQDTNVSITTNASSAGTYVFPSLLVGNYKITVEKTGFKKAVYADVEVRSNQVSESKIVLAVGEVTAVVEVQAGAEIIKTESSTLEATFSGNLANNLPVGSLGGDVKEFAVFVPGTTTQEGGVLGSGGSIGGARPRFNGFSIDGVDDNKMDVNGPVQPVIQESVAEFTLLTNQFNAESGHSAGGQFNVITKSGTNNWHGAAWEFNRNRNYNAADNQQKERIQSGAATNKDRFDYNRMGASAGGPVIHDKLFTYGAFERQNNGLASGSPTFESPTAAGLATLNSLAYGSAVQSILAQFPVAPVQTGVVPVTVNSVTTDIPVGSIQSVAPNYVNQYDYLVNLDANLDKHQVRGRFLYDRFRAPDYNSTQPQAQFFGTYVSDARKVIITDAWTIASNLMNDFRVSYSRLIGPKLVLPAGFENFPNIEIDELSSNLGPNGISPQAYIQNVYQAMDNITYIRGKHTFKAGAEFRNNISFSEGLPRARGEWDYASLNTFINDLVPDGANGALRGAGSGTWSGNSHSFFWFAQDDWKVTPRLILNLGLRYEYNGVGRNDNLQAGNSIADDPNFGIFFRAPKPDKNNFMPKFGFAWDPNGHGKWAVRGGAGVAFDVWPNNFSINSLPPQLQSEQNPDLTCALPGAPAWCPSYLANTGGQGFLQGGGLLQVNVPPVTQAEARALTQSLILDRVDPKIITWTLGVQHELFKDTSIELRYLGTRGISLPVQKRLNSASAFDSRFPGGGLTPLPTYILPSDVPAAIPTPASTLADFDAFVTKPLKVDGFLGNLTANPPSGSSTYHSGSVDVIHRMARGLYIRGNYTYSKNIDNATNELFSSRVNPRRPQDANDFQNERGRSVLDLNHKLAVAFVYELPKLKTAKGYLKAVANGWQWGGTYLAQTGQPVTALSNLDSNRNGDPAGDRTVFNPAGIGLTGSTVSFLCNAGSGGATSVVADAATCGAGNDANIVGYVADDPTARFIQAGVGAVATTGRNTVSTPGINIWNMSIFKTTTITERFSIQFRAETYDTFNHRNFSIGLPTNNGAIDQFNPNPLQGGYIFVTSGLFLDNKQFSGGSRTMQLGLRLVW